MDQKSLKEVANLNDAAVAMFEEYATRERFRREINLKRLRRELSHKYGDIDSKQLLEVFERLQELSLGAVIYGRNGRANKFYWNYNLKDVAQAVKGKIPVNDLVPLKPLPGHRPPPMPPSRVPKSIGTRTSPPIAPVTQLAGPGDLQIFVVNQTNQLRRFKISAQNNSAFMTIIKSLGEVIGDS